MDPLTVKHNHMINPTKNSEVYYVSLSEYIMWFLAIVQENCTQRYILNIPINMYTWCNSMRKYHVFFHIYPTVTYNSMNGYHPYFHLILYVRKRTSYKNIVSCSSYTSKYSYENTYEDNSAHTHKQKNTKLSSYTSSLLHYLIHRYLRVSHSPAQETVYQNHHKIYQG